MKHEHSREDEEMSFQREGRSDTVKRMALLAAENLSHRFGENQVNYDGTTKTDLGPLEVFNGISSVTKYHCIHAWKLHGSCAP
eukprot:2938549-Pleurochrysis_carterae.AAC.1